jgi:acetyl esterase/lipase
MLEPMRPLFLVSLLWLIGCVPTSAPRTEAGSALKLLSNLTDSSKLTKLEFAYGARSRQKLDVYVPKPAPTQPRAVVIFGYGGGYRDGNRDEYAFVGEAFSSLGLITVIYDYRLYPAVSFPTYLEDAALVMRWAVDHARRWNGDATRLILAGHSAGAHIAAMLATNPKYLRAVGLEPRDLQLVISLGGGYDFYDFESGFLSKDIAEVMQGVSDPLMTQPIWFLNDHAPPMLLAHARQDQVLPINQARRFRDKAKAVGANLEYFEYDGDHASTVINLAAALRWRSNLFDDIKQSLEKRGLLR